MPGLMVEGSNHDPQPHMAPKSHTQTHVKVSTSRRASTRGPSSGPNTSRHRVFSLPRNSPTCLRKDGSHCFVGGGGGGVDVVGKTQCGVGFLHLLRRKLGWALS